MSDLEKLEDSMKQLINHPQFLTELGLRRTRELILELIEDLPVESRDEALKNSQPLIDDLDLLATIME